jgi:hypothetical protein
VVITEVHYHPVVTAAPALPPLVFENPDLAAPVPSGEDVMIVAALSGG